MCWTPRGRALSRASRCTAGRACTPGRSPTARVVGRGRAAGACSSGFALACPSHRLAAASLPPGRGPAEPLVRALALHQDPERGWPAAPGLLCAARHRGGPGAHVQLQASRGAASKGRGWGKLQMLAHMSSFRGELLHGKRGTSVCHAVFHWRVQRVLPVCWRTRNLCASERACSQV